MSAKLFNVAHLLETARAKAWYTKVIRSEQFILGLWEIPAMPESYSPLSYIKDSLVFLGGGTGLQSVIKDRIVKTDLQPPSTDSRMMAAFQ